MTAQEALEALNTALLSTTPACADDNRFTNDDTDPATVKPICNRCPLRNLCKTYAERARPRGGIWAGKKYSHTPKGETA